MSSIELGGAAGAEQIRTPVAETQAGQPQGSVRLGGQAVQKMPSLSQLVQDLQEEISFAHQEKAESKEKFDEGIEDRAARMRERMIKRIKQVYESQSSDNQQANSTQQMLSKIRSGQFRNPDDLLEELGMHSSDYAEMFSILVSVADELPADSAAASLVDRAIVAASSKWEHQIAAGANTLAEAEKHAEQSGIERDQLQRAYQDSVLNYESVVGTLSELVSKFGLDQVEAGTAFLQEAARADLIGMPSSVEPERLEQTLLELQGMKIFHTLRESVDMAYERASTSDEALAKIDRKWLASNFIRSLNDPSEFDASIKMGVSSGDPRVQNRVLLLQDLRIAITETPEHYFQQGGKDRAITPWQNEIDQLIYEESEA